MSDSWEASMSRRLRSAAAGEAAPAPEPVDAAPAATGGVMAEPASRVASRMGPAFLRGSGRSGAGGRWRRRLRGGWRADDVPGVLTRSGTVIQRPVPTGRRVVWVGVAGGVGVTTTAYAVAALMARLRGDGAAVLGAPEDRTGLPWRADEDGLRSVPGLWTGHRVPDVADLDSIPCLAVPHPGGRVEAGGAALHLSRHRSFVMIDSGVTCDPGVLADAHCVVLVAPPTAVAAEVLGDLAGDLVGVGAPAKTRVALVDTGRDTGVRPREFVSALRDVPVPVDVVPVDAHLATGCRIHLDLVGEEALVGLSRLAAGIVDTATGTAPGEAGA